MKIFSTFVVLATIAQSILADTHIEECKFVNVLLGKDEKFDCCKDVDGVECTKDGHITYINLPEVNKYDLPDSIGNMPYLESLDLSSKELKGTLPQDLGNLKRITNINFNDNKIEGTIPESIGKLSTLEHLTLNYNDLEGTIPKSIGQLTKLITLDLSHNRLSGEIPSAELEKLPDLGFFSIEDNEKLYGKAPNSDKIQTCLYERTKICYAKGEARDYCYYPETYYDCAVCKDEKISTLANGMCTCNEGYTGPAYIGCTKSNGNNGNSSGGNNNTGNNNTGNNNTGNNNTGNNNTGNNNTNNNETESGALATLSSIKLLYIALAVFTIVMLN